MPERSNGKPKAAAIGSLNIGTLNELVLRQAYERAMTASAVELRGASIRPSQLRGGLVRAILIEFGGGRVHQISFYQKMVADLGTRFAVREELRLLEDLGLIVIKADPDDGRMMSVWPTQRLVYWAVNEMPRMPEGSAP